VLVCDLHISGFWSSPMERSRPLQREPVLLLEPGYVYMLIGHGGHTIAPWMPIYLQAAVVENGNHRQDFTPNRALR